MVSSLTEQDTPKLRESTHTSWGVLNSSNYANLAQLLKSVPQALGSYSVL